MSAPSYIVVSVPNPTTPYAVIEHYSGVSAGSFGGKCVSLHADAEGAAKERDRLLATRTDCAT